MKKPEPFEIEIDVVEDEAHPGFFVAYEPAADGEEPDLARAKTEGMALGLALQELGRRTIAVELALRARMPDAERLARGL